MLCIWEYQRASTLMAAVTRGVMFPSVRPSYSHECNLSAMAWGDFPQIWYDRVELLSRVNWLWPLECGVSWFVQEEISSDFAQVFTWTWCWLVNGQRSKLHVHVNMTYEECLKAFPLHLEQTRLKCFCGQRSRSLRFHNVHNWENITMHNVWPFKIKW